MADENVTAILCLEFELHYVWISHLKMKILKYSGPLTYEINSLARAGRNSNWS
jgi:hypothetical protein